MLNKAAFSIAESPAAFKVLSSNLYSNPVLAVIRELVTNAYDAQVAANTNDIHAIELHLPEGTLDENYFRVRDWGNGLSEDEIFVVYTQFFSSTKSNDETQVGTFGLGSKSPFALTENYTVNSYQNGTKKSYSMDSSSGIPTVQLISTESTSEHDGLEVIINKWTKPFEYYVWERAAEKLFSTTAFLPKVNFSENTLDHILDKREYYTVENIRIGSLSRYDSCIDIQINVAGIGFPLEYNEIKEYFGKDYYEALEELQIKGLTAFVSKSSVTLTPSREHLHFDEKTIESIKSAILRVINEKYPTQIDTYKNIYHVLKRANSLCHAKTYFSNISKRIFAAATKVESCFGQIKGNACVMKVSPALGKVVPFNTTLVPLLRLFSQLSNSEERVALYSLNMKNATKAQQKSFEAISYTPDKMTSSAGFVHGNIPLCAITHFSEAKKDPQVDTGYYFFESNTSKLKNIFNKITSVDIGKYKSYMFKVKEGKKETLKAKKLSLSDPFFTNTTKFFINGTDFKIEEITNEMLENYTVYKCVERSTYRCTATSESYIRTFSKLLGENTLIALRVGSASFVESKLEKNNAITINNLWEVIKSQNTKLYSKVIDILHNSNLKSNIAMSHIFRAADENNIEIPNELKSLYSYKLYALGNTDEDDELQKLGLPNYGYSDKSNLIQFIEKDEYSLSDKESEILNFENDIFQVVNEYSIGYYSYNQYKLDKAFEVAKLLYNAHKSELTNN